MSDLPHLLSSKRSKEKKIIPICIKGIRRKIVTGTYFCMKKYIAHIYIYIYNRVRLSRKMMSFTQNDWSKSDIIKIIILAKRGIYTIHAVITKKYKKYPSTKILKHANVLAKVNKLTYVHLHNMKLHGAYSITIHVRTMTILGIIYDQKE